MCKVTVFKFNQLLQQVSEREIHSLKSRVYFLCADRILSSLVDCWSLDVDHWQKNENNRRRRRQCVKHPINYDDHDKTHAHFTFGINFCVSLDILTLYTFNVNNNTTLCSHYTYCVLIGWDVIAANISFYFITPKVSGVIKKKLRKKYVFFILIVTKFFRLFFPCVFWFFKHFFEQ